METDETKATRGQAQEPAPEQEIFVTVSDALEYLFCPRFIFFMHDGDRQAIEPRVHRPRSVRRRGPSPARRAPIGGARQRRREGRAPRRGSAGASCQASSGEGPRAPQGRLIVLAKCCACSTSSEVQRNGWPALMAWWWV